MNEVMRTCFASVVSELQQSDIYMTVKARLFETPKANLNGARVTAAFLNEIVENEEKYVGLPLVADVKALANGRYDHLGHLYDARTGQFYSTQIGSFYKFEREDFDGGSYLVGYARIMKRNQAVCKAIAELFAEGALKFSFEISCGSYEKLDDGTIRIDVGENNFLEGAAIVTFPACEDAVALELVAECDRIADDLRKGENEMTDVKESAEVVAEEVTEAVAEEAVETTAEVNETKEEQVEETEETAACGKKKEETADVVVTEVHEERTSTYAYDNETCEEAVQSVSVETRTTHVEKDANLVVAGDDTVEGDDGGEDEPEDVPVVEDEPQKKTAEEMISELAATIAELRKEIAELKEAQVVVAAKQEEKINPFIAEIKPVHNKYSLLEKAESAEAYTLLGKAF